MTLFTVFTPTFNRAYTLRRLFDSLVAQTNHDFEWLVVDDGSTDDTASLIKELSGRAPFPVRYLWQPNAGTHHAMNAGVQAADGELFLTLDSDDWCVPQALERFRHHWTSIPATERDRYAAVTALCQDPAGQLIGDPFPRDVFDSNSIELRYRYRVVGDKWGFTRTDVMRRFPFPSGDFDLIPAGIVWNAIAREYRTRYVNERLKYVEYLPDGQTRNTAKFKPRGYALFYRKILSDAAPYLLYSPRQVAREAGDYCRYSFLAADPLRTQVSQLDGAIARVLWALAVPYGFEKARRTRRCGAAAARRPRLVMTTTVPVTADVTMRGQLRSLSEHGPDVHMVSSPGPLLDQIGEREGVTTHGLPMRREPAPIADLVSLWRWLRLLRRLRPDVISYSTPKAGLVAGLASVAVRVPRRVYILRGLRFEGEHGAREKVLRRMEYLSCATAQTVVAVSPSVAETAIAAGLVPAHKVVVVGDGSSNGVDAELFRPPSVAERAAARAAAGIARDRVAIGFVGRLTPDKGIACLEEAFARLRARIPQVALVLVGEQDLRDCAAARRLSADPDVRTLGAVDDPMGRYAALDILCLPTRREGFPNVVLEAAACAIPAVTTRVTGACDAVVNEETGLVVPVDDAAALATALERLCTDVQLRRQYGDKARERVLRDYRPDRIWHGLLDVYVGGSSWSPTACRQCRRDES